MDFSTLFYYCISASNWTVGFFAESTPELSPLSQVECKTKIWRTCMIVVIKIRYV